MVGIERVLVPVDFAECSDAAVLYALDLAAKYGAAVEFIHVFELPPHATREAMVSAPDQPTQTMADYLRGRAQSLLDELVEHHDRGEETAHAQHLMEGHPDQAIISRATEMGADLIVMGTHGHAGSLKHRLVGSVVDRVLRQAPCPVLVVHEGDV